MELIMSVERISEQLKLVVRQEQIALTHGYPENLPKLYAPKFRAHLVRTTPIAELDMRGSRHLAGVYGAAFRNLVPMFLIQIAQDNHVASRYVLEGTFENEYFGVPRPINPFEST
jgi:hypothetical protein